MSVDATTMVIITAVGGTGVTVGGALLKYVRALHNNTVTQLQKQNDKLEKRTSECEEDRKALHGRLNEQSERITNISQTLGRLEGRLDNGK
jgi:chaperonin cofactor prefoldin